MRRFLSAAAAIFLLIGDLFAQDSGAARRLQWGPVPPILPPGAQIAVVSGDDEFVEVTAGTLLVGVGDRLDLRKTQP